MLVEPITLRAVVRNGRGEEFAVTVKFTPFEKPGVSVGKNRWVAQLLDAPEDCSWFFTPSAMWGDGHAIGEAVEVRSPLVMEYTNADAKRQATYPFYLVRGGDTTRRGKYRISVAGGRDKFYADALERAAKSARDYFEQCATDESERKARLDAFRAVEVKS